MDTVDSWDCIILTRWRSRHSSPPRERLNVQTPKKLDRLKKKKNGTEYPPGYVEAETTTAEPCGHRSQREISR